MRDTPSDKIGFLVKEDVVQPKDLERQYYFLKPLVNTAELFSNMQIMLYKAMEEARYGIKVGKTVCKKFKRAWKAHRKDWQVSNDN